MFSTVAIPVYTPTNSVLGSHFFSIFSNFVIPCFFIIANRHEVISHCGFGLHFPNDKQYWSSFLCLLAIYMSSLENCLFRSSAQLMFFCCCWVVWVLYIFWILIPYWKCNLQVSSLFWWFVFWFCWWFPLMCRRFLCSCAPVLFHIWTHMNVAIKYKRK